MQTNKTTNVLLGIIVLALIVLIAFFVVHQNSTSSVSQNTGGTGSSGTGTSSEQQTGGTTGTPAAPPAPVVPPGMKQYTDASFGFYLDYPASLAASTDSAGNVDLVGSGGSSTTTLAETTNTAPDPSGKWGPYTVSYANGGFVVTQQDEQTGNSETKPISPIATTTSGLPIFNGGIPTHGWGKYDYIVALSDTKFLTVSGPDMTGNPPYTAATDPTLAIAQSVTVQ